jgi:outer membrane immunogenic protein
MHRFAVVQAGLLSIIAFSGASAADLALRTYTKAPPAVVATVYDWSGFDIGLNGGGASSHECYTVIGDAVVAVVRNSEGCRNAAVTDNKYYLLSRPHRPLCTGGTSF